MYAFLCTCERTYSFAVQRPMAQIPGRWTSTAPCFAPSAHTCAHCCFMLIQRCALCGVAFACNMVLGFKRRAWAACRTMLPSQLCLSAQPFRAWLTRTSSATAWHSWWPAARRSRSFSSWMASAASCTLSPAAAPTTTKVCTGFSRCTCMQSSITARFCVILTRCAWQLFTH